jgi:ceramide glucosyltransferase
MSLEMAFPVAATALLGYTVLAMEQRRRALGLRIPTQPLAHYPSLSIVRPIRGLDPGAKENLDAALDNGYPGEIETLFVFDDEDEPALPLARAAIAEHERSRRPGSARVIIAGPPQHNRTGKLNAMIAGASVARGDLIGFADSDIRPDRDALRKLVELLLGSPRAGDVFAPVSVSEPAQALGDVGYALMLNALYSPEVHVLSQRRGEVPFIMGQLMIFRRETLSAIGGLDCAAGQLVDDMHIGQCVAAKGYKNIMATEPVRIIDWGMSWSEFARTYRRWIAFSRTGLSMTFFLGAAQPYIVFWIGLLGLLGALSAGLPLTAALCGLLMGAACVGVLVLNRAAGGTELPWRYVYGPFLVMLGGPFILLAQFLWPQVKWRGRTYGLNARARLASSVETAVHSLPSGGVK